MKKALCLVLVALLFTGCGSIRIPVNSSNSSSSESSSQPAYTPPTVSQTFERDPGESELFTGDWVVNTVYTREKVIAGRFTAETNAGGAKDFAYDFVKANLEPFGVTDIMVADLSVSTHFNIDSGVFYRDGGVYVGEYPITFQTVSEVPGLANQIFSEDEKKFECLFWIQVVLKQTPGNCLLLGFVTNQDERISDYARLHEFLCEDPTYNRAFYTPPETFESPDAVSVSKILGRRKISDAVPLGNGNIAMLLYELDEDPVSKVQFYLKIFEPDFKTAVNVVKLWKGYADVGLERLNGGNILVWQTQYIVSDDGTEKITYYERRFDANGKELASAVKAGNYAYLSDKTYILQDQGSLYLAGDGGDVKLLMAGIVGDDPHGMDNRGYAFHKRIDDTHFTYSYCGYESAEVKGVYDIETGKAVELPVKGYYNCTQAFGDKFAANTTINYDGDQYYLYLCAIGAEPSLISRGNEKSDGFLPVAFSKDGKFFVFAEKTGLTTYNITVIDTIYTWIALQVTVFGKPDALAISGRMLLVFTGNDKLTSVEFPDLPAILPDDGYLNDRLST